MTKQFYKIGFSKATIHYLHFLDWQAMDVPLIEYFKVGPWDYIGAIKEVRGCSTHKPKGDGAFQNYLVLSLSNKTGIRTWSPISPASPTIHVTASSSDARTSHDDPESSRPEAITMNLKFKIVIIKKRKLIRGSSRFTDVGLKTRLFDS